MDRRQRRSCNPTRPAHKGRRYTPETRSALLVRWSGIFAHRCTTRCHTMECCWCRRFLAWLQLHHCRLRCLRRLYHSCRPGRCFARPSPDYHQRCPPRRCFRQSRSRWSSCLRSLRFQSPRSWCHYWLHLQYHRSRCPGGFQWRKRPRRYRSSRSSHTLVPLPRSTATRAPKRNSTRSRVAHKNGDTAFGATSTKEPTMRIW